MNYQDINAETIDRWVKEGWEWGKAIDHDTFQAAIEGKWEIKLTPVKYAPHSWFGDLHGQKVLGLASGGGQQMPILTALGAKCTVLDYSDQQLESEAPGCRARRLRYRHCQSRHDPAFAFC